MDKENSFRPGYLINRTSRLFARWSDARFRDLGLASAQIPVLASLKNGDARTQKDLAQLMQIEQPTMAQLLTRMERDGLIKRSTDPNDKRSSKISLTSLARARLPEARAILDEGAEVALHGLSERDIATLSRLLTKVMENMEEALGVEGDGGGLKP